MTRSRRARREAARRRARENPTDVPANEAPHSESSEEAHSPKKVMKSRPGRPWYRDPRFQQAVFLLVSAGVVAGLVFLFNQQQITSNLPTPTLTPFPTSTVNATGTAGAQQTATARASVTPDPSVSPQASPAASPGASPAAQARPTYTAPPAMTIDTTKIYTVTMDTARGLIVMELNPQDAPVTVNNFVRLVRDGFYDGLTFHRVEDWVVQGGDPVGNGTGGPGYRFNDEPVKGEYLRGVVAMANSGPNTNGSQFFILKRDTPLPKQYNLFGRVVDGMSVVDQIQRGDRINKVTVVES
ncbi:MAG: peptidylprolyl isomerase [Dehalococcoidia bacterium]